MEELWAKRPLEGPGTRWTDVTEKYLEMIHKNVKIIEEVY